MSTQRNSTLTPEPRANVYRRVPEAITQAEYDDCLKDVHRAARENPDATRVDARLVIDSGSYDTRVFVATRWERDGESWSLKDPVVKVIP